MEVKKGLPDRNGVKVGYKQTEVGVIPEDWEVKKLNTICDVRDGTHESPKYLDDGVTFITSKNIINGKIDFSDVTLISKNDAININKRSKVNKGDILMSMIGTIGNSVLIDFEPDFCIKNVALFKPQKVLGRFFIQLLYSLFYQTYINGKLDGGIQKFISLGVMREFDVPLPPTKAEQTAIATALSDADTLIQSMEKLIAKKRLIKQGAMQELLKPKEGWVVKKLGEVADIYRGASPRPIDSPIWFDAKSLIGWVRISDVSKSTKFLKETTQKLSELGIKNSRFVNKDNLIMSICATVGRPILTELDVCIHDGFVVFSNPKVEKEYLYYFLTAIENDWSKFGQTGSQMNLNTGLINSTQITYPPNKDEQTAIAKVLSDMDAEIAALETKLTKYKQVKQGMMQQLLTGRTRLI